MGGSWAVFGTGLGGSGAHFGHFWVVFDGFFGVLNRACFKHGSKMGSKKAFGWFWEGSGRILGGFWEGLGWILVHFWKDFGKIW